MDWNEELQAGEDMDRFMRVVQMKARDHARVPMQVGLAAHTAHAAASPGAVSRCGPKPSYFQWNGSRNAGFTTGTPWMRVHDDYRDWNIEGQMLDPDSVWHFWRRLLVMRSEQPVLVSFLKASSVSFDLIDGNRSTATL